MERKKSSGKPFQMRSGNATPYPFLGKALKTIGGGIKNMLPGSKGNSGGAGAADDVNTKIDEIHAALVGDEGDTMMTKKTHMYTHADSANPTVKETDPNTGKRHYHAAKTTSQLPKKP
tara:strand:+ start:237 stop:590 length:354 start_codon:yes stop_codon:yes gene_type:complete